MGCDRISELPDILLTQILLNLPTKDSVKTSVLSKRWEFLWLSVPGLDLKVKDFPSRGKGLESFIDKFLNLNQESRMQKFKIEYKKFEDEQLVWIATAIDRGVQHLDVETGIGPDMPHNFYKSNTLVSLKLVTIGIVDPGFVVSLPCLKIMHFEDIVYDDEPLIIEKLISGCPVLVDLTVIRRTELSDVLRFLRVRSQTLKRFRLTFKYLLFSKEYSVEIDAPRLEYLSFKDNQSDLIVIKNLNSLSMIDIDTEFVVNFGGSPLEPEDLRKRDTIRDFLTGISIVRHMIISQPTLEVLYVYSKLGPIPKFPNLYRLDAALSSSLLQFLPAFLECCPNLKNLILDFAVSAQPEQSELSYVPQCLSLTLESVEIKQLIMREETGIKLVNYFLKNSAVLKKFTVRFTDSPMTIQELDICKDIYKSILTFTKRSRSCQVFVY
ncbi:hypothetical protein EUTSA_v10000888mg [Eutrema salsugineum]|uniref:FBD domain-containing protein n=1 Tax=Eutrema salsugineum TaxID=72664 RepID=V4LB48_EUTSA|nr:F-box/FBD/LRR-repeat protein At2g26030 [Eutrema salsugineum]XP_024010976.1 F-box/FBD/LRR-repeat protein At2g26030 [Eutrema salsugineum]XP_024010977.1 F-box/FBD/LRR-repeat protein At2g26030 [Eutrema salsugineum]ESQ39592.1 hypothetical protein EUTSA_v10000888mg [Eutrema salsugineum]